MNNEKNRTNCIPIVFSANAKYAPYISVTITSIIKNSSEDFFYDFYVLYTELPTNVILRLEDNKGENYSTTCINVQELCTDGMYISAYFSKEMYYRIMIPEILPQYDKVIYLDCDIVVLKDISELYATDISNYLLGGIRNLMHEKMKKYIIYSLDIKPEKYINSGVLLINAQKCREDKFMEKSFAMLKKRQDFRYPDQDLINMVARDKIFYFDPRWNFTWHYRHLQESTNTLLHLEEHDMQEFLECERNPYILHFTGEIKPWNNVNKYLSDRFWIYAKESNFYNLFLNRLINENVSSKTNQAYEKRISALEKSIEELKHKEAQRTSGADNKIKKMDECPKPEYTMVAEQQDDFLDKYNQVIGSKSYKLGRLLTFPFRKIVDFFHSVKERGFIQTLKLFPNKVVLYKNIILRK